MNNIFTWGIELLAYIYFIQISNSKIQVSYKNMLNMLLIIDISNKSMLDILKYLNATRENLCILKNLLYITL